MKETNIIYQLHKYVKILGLVMILIIPLTSFAQNYYKNGYYGIVGQGYFDYSLLAEVKNDTLRFYVINKPMCLGGRGIDPVATCTISKVSNSTYTIQSEKPYFFENIFDTMDIVERESDTETDSVDVELYFPNIEYLYHNISFYTEDESIKFQTNIKQQKYSFRVKNSPLTGLSISPKEYMASNNQEQYFGVLSCRYDPDCRTSNVINITKRTSALFITIPLLEDGFFFQWFINGDYITFKNKNEFEWKNMRLKFIAKDNEQLKKNKQWRYLIMSGIGQEWFLR